ncbi:MAG: aspartate carbamoyltransferase regulatory subunit [Bacteroidota bacterium]|nr:aspartate carbamoyltransferase regulatory subunit [Bacteroidota bacterium]
MEKISRELKVSAIENGTVIDHIPSNRVFQVIRLLDLYDSNEQIFVGVNLESEKLKDGKGIVKVSNRYFADWEIDKISLVAPTATLIEIKDFCIVEKRKVAIPDKIQGIVKCFNPNCITNHQPITTCFNVVDKDDLKLQCHYCEKITAKENIVFL